MRSGEYSIARPLQLFTPGDPSGLAAAFIEFCLGQEGQEIVREIWLCNGEVAAMVRFNTKEPGVRLLLLAATSASILIVVLIFIFLGREAIPFLRHPGLSELLGTRWVPVSFQKESFGVLPLIVGSLLVTVTSMVVTVPVGICAAVYIAEIAKPWERRCSCR